MRICFVLSFALVVSLPYAVIAELSVSLNQDNRFILHANQESLVSLRFASQGRSLVPAESAAPFQLLLMNNNSGVFLLNDSPITLGGDVTLSVGWNPSASQDVNVFSGLSNGSGGSVPISYESCRDSCPKPSINVTLDEQERFVLHGSNHALTSLDFRSTGSLAVADSAGPFDRVTVNTPQRIRYEAPASGVTIDGMVTLSAGWNPAAGVGDVQYEYVEVDGKRTGMLHIPEFRISTESACRCHDQ